MNNLNNLPLVVVSLLLGMLIGLVWALLAARQREKVKSTSSLRIQRSVLGGKFAEQLAPYLPGFPTDLKPTEAKFIGDPVDFLVFNGLDDKNISEVVFLEVKTGKARLNSNEKALKDAVDNKRVRYVSYTIPENITHDRSGYAQAASI